MSEKEELKKEILQVNYEEDMFKISVGDGKYIFGVRTTDEAYNGVLAKTSLYKTLYNTLKDIDSKIKYSFEEGIENTYSPAMNNNFSIIAQEPGSREEFLAYYFSENALFRLSTLWDILAQFYNIFYNLGIKKEKIHYAEIFNPSRERSIPYSDKAEKINSYINEELKHYEDGSLTGTHAFVKNLRNKMTHRNSPSITELSNFDINIRNHPSFIFYEMIKDYIFVSKELKEILNKIELELKRLLENS